MHDDRLRVAGERFGARASIWTREEQFIAVGIVDLKRIVAPPRFLGGSGALQKLTAKAREALKAKVLKAIQKETDVKVEHVLFSDFTVQ